MPSRVVSHSTITCDLVHVESRKHMKHGNQTDLENSSRLDPDMQCLKLSYKKLTFIDNTLLLSSLKCLWLDNNDIAEIVNLSPLVNLEWLDLSFNGIAKMEGLETLANLTDLILSHNRIRYVSGLENLNKLKVLGLSYNDIRSTKDLSGLAVVGKSLRSLTLAGNVINIPTENLKAFVLSAEMCPKLAYYDYELLVPLKTQPTQPLSVIPAPTSAEPHFLAPKTDPKPVSSITVEPALGPFEDSISKTADRIREKVTESALLEPTDVLAETSAAIDTLISNIKSVLSDCIRRSLDGLEAEERKCYEMIRSGASTEDALEKTMSAANELVTSTQFLDVKNKVENLVDTLVFAGGPVGESQPPIKSAVGAILAEFAENTQTMLMTKTRTRMASLIDSAKAVDRSA